MNQAQATLAPALDQARPALGAPPRPPAREGEAQAAALPLAALAVRCGPVDREVVLKLIDGLKEL